MSKYCKKCGKELPIGNKKNLCENCQNKANGVIRKIGGAVVFFGSIALWVITKGKFGGPKA